MSDEHYSLEALKQFIRFALHEREAGGLVQSPQSEGKKSADCVANYQLSLKAIGFLALGRV